MRQSVGKMDDYRKPLRISLLWLLSLILIHSSASAQSQTGFISIDCGGIGTDTYTDTVNGLNWQPDGELMKSGSTSTIKDPYLLGSGNTSRELTTLRYFDNLRITKFCYELGPLTAGSFYLIRASFLHGNYNGNGDSDLSFDLLLEGDLWDSIVVSNTSLTIRKEVYIQAKETKVNVCVAPGSSSHPPFISSIEIRPIDSNFDSAMMINQTNLPLHLVQRYNLGAPNSLDIRYPDDIFDRIWYAYTEAPKAITQNPIASNLYETPPNVVMQSTFLSLDGISESLTFTGLEPGKYFFYFNFAEIEIGVEIGDRIFDIYKDGVYFYGPMDIMNITGVSFKTYGYYFYNTTISNPTLTLTLKARNGSRLGPICNAFAIYRYSNAAPTLTTLTTDVEALSELKTSLGLNNWTGDPCLPLVYPYTWVNCSLSTPPRVTSLLLPNMNLQGILPSSINLLNELKEINFEGNSFTGKIPNLSALSKLQKLNLGNNNLSGTIPEFLANLPLDELLLQYNNLSGQIPLKLLERVSSSNFNLNVTGNPYLCMSSNNCPPTTLPNPSPPPSPSSTLGWKNIVIIVVVIVGGISIISIIGVIVYGRIRNDQSTPNNPNSPPNPIPNPYPPPNPIPGDSSSISNVIVEPKVVEFKYEDIIKATNSFEEIIGVGGFGYVFSGKWKMDKIAVKVLSKDSCQGAEQFLNEVTILTKVFHVNLVPFVGYCQTMDAWALVYKYMSNKSLRDKLNALPSILFPWRERLCIALDAAKGLDYLHTSCEPIIIHGDVKSSNILLNKDMRGRIGDFGLSRFYSNDTNMTLTIRGSMGYLDPTFGVVLLEIITGRPALIPNHQPEEERTLTDWVRNRYNRALSVRKWMDKTLKREGKAITETISMVLDKAKDCLEDRFEDRPSMHDVVALLTNALEIEDNKSSFTLEIEKLDPQFK